MRVRSGVLALCCCATLLAGACDDSDGDDSDGDDDTISRINLRMPEHLKARVEQAAVGEGLSVNAWLVRAAAARLERRGSLRRDRPVLTRSGPEVDSGSDAIRSDGRLR